MHPEISTPEIRARSARHGSQASGADGAFDKALRGEAFKRELGEILASTWAWNSGPIDERVLGATAADEARRLARVFALRAPELTEAAAAAVDAGDGRLAWSAAHKLKGLASLVGARALVEACEAMHGIDSWSVKEARNGVVIVWKSNIERLRVASRAACAALAADEPPVP